MGTLHRVFNAILAYLYDWYAPTKRQDREYAKKLMKVARFNIS